MSSEDKKVEESVEKLTHVLAEFESPGALIEAAKKVRDAGYTKWDCHSPFPVHGLDPAMGIKMTILPVIVFGAGIAGLLGGLLLQFWANDWHWPWIVSGKPFWSLPANIPIAFEATVLIAAITAFFGMWALNKLPQVWHPLFTNDRFMRATDDSFFVAIDADDEQFNQTKTSAFLTEIGATAVEPIKIITGPKERRIPKIIYAVILCTSVAALVPFAFIAKWRADKSELPHWHINPNMDFQPKARAQKEFSLFNDERGSRVYEAGTIARAGAPGLVSIGTDGPDLALDDHLYRGISGGQWATTFPSKIELTAQTMETGETRYNTYCAPCHGHSGNGIGIVAQRVDSGPTGGGVPQVGWNPPSDLMQENFIQLPHGQLFNTITHGIRTMPAYSAQISVEDRWAIILYLRALQRRSCGTINDIPADQRSQIRQAN